MVIAHVDNACFCTGSKNSKMKIQETVPHYVKMHEATGGKVQKEKVSVHYWRL